MVPAPKKTKKLPTSGVFTKVKAQNKIVKKSKKDEALPDIVLKKTSKDPNASSSVLLLKHVPYGFFEEECFKYFSQYGKVTRVRVMRNPKGGFSGMVYIGFQYPEVAQVVQTVMDKSIMLKDHVVKCQQLKEKEVPAFVKFGGLYGKYKPTKHREHLKEKVNAAYENNKGDNPHKVVAWIKKALTKAKENGINYDFDFTEKYKEAVKNDPERKAEQDEFYKKFLEDEKTKQVAAKHKIKL